MIWQFIILSLLSVSIAHLINMGRRNLINLVFIVELMLMCVSLTFLVYYYLNANNLPNHDALFAAYSIIVVSAAETSVILALLSRINRKVGSILVGSDEPDGKKKSFWF